MSEANFVGRELGRYRIVSELGRGAMGVVYEAEDLTLGRRVALKMLPPSLVSDGERRARLLREARAAAALNHASIVTIHEVGEIGGQPFVAMELVRGETLARRLEKLARDGGRGVAVAEVLRIGIAIARGLSCAHEAGQVHRDLKPDNVMLGRDDEVKVLDFGLAKLREPSPGVGASDVTASLQTQEGRILGTPAYMSPEQAKGLSVDARSDVFALGVVLYEMLTGHRPFSGQTTVELLIAIDRDAPEPVTSLRFDVPADLVAIVQRCLEKQPPARYASGAEVVAALDACRSSAGSGERAAVEAGAAPAGDVARSTLGVVREATPGKQPQQRRALVAGAICALAVVAGWLWARSPRTAANPSASASASAPRPAGTPITSLPEPRLCNPAAKKALREGLQAFRGEGWSQAHLAFERAVAADPDCPEAHLRKAQTGRFRMAADELRPLYARAVTLRDGLSERDQVLLDSLEPLIRRDPPSRAAAAEILRKAARRFPDDAEILQLAAFESSRDASVGEEALGFARRSVEIDPFYADGLQSLAAAEREAGHAAASRAALTRCIDHVPNATDCLLERIITDRRDGRCESIEGDARRWISREPGSVGGYEFLAAALAADPGQSEAAERALKQRWAKLPEGEREWRSLDERARLAELAGDFERTETLVAQLERAVENATTTEPHARLTDHQIELFSEIGRDQRAVDAAARFIRQRGAWLHDVKGDFQQSLVMQLEPRALAFLRSRGKLSNEEWQRLWTAWSEPRGTDLKPQDRWVYETGLAVESAEQARAAVAVMPPGGSQGDPLNPHYGRVLSLAGRHADAVRELRASTAPCIAFTAPFLATRAQLWLGEALEQSDDKQEACAAYRIVLQRWGSAKPKSVTAEKARARSKALGCE